MAKSSTSAGGEKSDTGFSFGIRMIFPAVLLVLVMAVLVVEGVKYRNMHDIGILTRHLEDAQNRQEISETLLEKMGASGAEGAYVAFLLSGEPAARARFRSDIQDAQALLRTLLASYEDSYGEESGRLLNAKALIADVRKRISVYDGKMDAAMDIHASGAMEANAAMAAKGMSEGREPLNRLVDDIRGEIHDLQAQIGGGISKDIALTRLVFILAAAMAVCLPFLLFFFLHGVRARVANNRELLRIKSAVDHMEDAFLTVDENGVIVSVNNAALNLFGWQAKGLLGKPLDILIPERFRGRHEHYFRAFMDGEIQERLIGVWREILAIRQDGKEFPIVILLKRFTNGAETLVSAVVRSIEEISRDEAVLTREEAVRSNRAKSRFLRIVTHELKTPLNSIIGFSDIIHHERLGPIPVRQYVEYAQEIRKSGQYMLNIVNDILDYTRLERGDMELNPQQVDLASLIDVCLDLVQDIAASKRQTLTVQMSQRPAIAKIDERTVRQAILNVLRNAVSFTPDRGSVSVTLDRAENIWSIVVADTGPGIPEEDMDRVFAPFEKAGDTSRQGFSAKSGGLGLGLAIGKRLIELNSGGIDISSEPGKGTTVSIRIPSNRKDDNPESEPLAAE